MRVALISPPFESVPPKLYGGTERVVDCLARGLVNEGVDVTLFASGDSRSAGTLVPVVDQALRLRQPGVKDQAAYHLKILSMVAERAGEFDVIHNHHDYWMLPLSRMTATPLISTLHGRLSLPDISEAFRAFPDCYYVSISDSQRVPLGDLSWFGTVYNGIDVKSLRYFERPGDYLAFLGRIDSDKRPDWAIRIAKASGVPLKIAAKIEGAEGQAYYDRFVRPHVDGRFIEFVGEINDAEKSEFLGGALALVFPIDWPEPFGLVMVEALACGTPVLARPCGSVEEILKDGVTGFVHLDIHELARRVQDVPRLSRMRCRRWVEERFSLERMTEDYIDVYRRVVELAADRPRAGQRLRLHRGGRDLLHSVERVADGNS